MKYSSTLVFLSDTTGYPERELIDLTKFMNKVDQDLKYIFNGIEFEPDPYVMSKIIKMIRSRKYS